MQNSQVLIVGAGPTGLVLALWLTKIGVRVRLIDKTDGPGTTSRALAVHARTLELYRQLGIADDVIEHGFQFPNVNLWVNQEPKAQVSIGEIGRGASPYPYVLVFPQDEHEKLLIKHLKNLGVEVERNTELVEFRDDGKRVRAQIKLASGRSEDLDIEYLAGCDGARSTVRKGLDTDFQGSTYPGMFYVADIEGQGPTVNGELHLALDKANFLAVFPLKGKGRARLIGTVEDIDQDSALSWNDVRSRVAEGFKIQVDKVNWFSTYHIHHRVASQFQKGRVFLLGDAGHIHSPVGGQGMNTGIGDAVNLAWKLGEVLKHGAKQNLLRTYEPERIAFAKQLVATTDRAFVFVSSKGWFARLVRTRLVPNILPVAVKFKFAQRLMFRTISQTGITYRDHDETSRAICAGDRLPWIASVDNFAPLTSLAYQVHIYGDAKVTGLPQGMPVHRFDWNSEMESKGLMRNRAYVVRPDGYIGEVS